MHTERDGDNLAKHMQTAADSSKPTYALAFTETRKYQFERKRAKISGTGGNNFKLPDNNFCTAQRRP